MSRKLFICLFALLSAIFFLLSKPTRQAKAAENGLWSTGYYVGWEQDRMPPDQIDYEAVTHVAHFSMWPRPDGSVDLKDLTPSYAREAVAAAHNAGRKIILVFGCVGAGSAFAGAASETNRSNFIANMINQMTIYGYDGLDIDWEENINWADYIALIRELRVELDKIDPKLLLTVAVAKGLTPPNLIVQVDEYLDQINIMSYWEPPRTQNMEDQVQAYLAVGIPASKIGGGIGLGDDGGIDTTPERVRTKCEYAKNNGLGGVMEWKIDDIYYGPNQPMPIMEVIKEYVYPVGPTLTPGLSPTPPSTSTPPPPRTPTPYQHCLPLGDIDCSGKVNGLDFGYLVARWGTADPKANLDNLGVVDALDALILLNNYEPKNP